MTQRLAFIGLGIMGRPMAAHLLNAGYPLTVFSRTRTKAQALLDRGAEWADSPADAARDADVVFLCLPDTPDVERCLLGEQGIASAARRGQIVVDHSTISPISTRKLAETLSTLDITLLDAPVSGGDVGARNATLSIMVGGEQAAFDRTLPMLQRVGKTITYCGPSGNGQLTKLVNQILVSGTLLAVSEAMSFAVKAGLDPAKTIAAVGSGAARSWQLEQLGPKMVAGDFRPGFMVDLMQKDLRLVLEFAASSRTSVPATSLVHQLFNAVQAWGGGRDGTQALYTVLERLAHLH